MKTHVGSVGAIWNWSPSLNLTFAYYRGGRSQDAAAKQTAQKFYFVPEYFLSKRTSLYLVALREQFNATGSALDTGTPLPAGTRHTNYVGLGVSHSF
jgi:GBP family porin